MTSSVEDAFRVVRVMRLPTRLWRTLLLLVGFLMAKRDEN
jgi:hypothetical protein